MQDHQNQLYNMLIAPLAQSLSSKVMAIGLFLVGVGYLRRRFSDRETWSREDFGKRLLLLLGVLMFSLYIVSSYQVGLSQMALTETGAAGTGPAEARSAGVEMQGTVIPFSTKLKVLLLGPLEVLLAMIEGTMFLVLGVDEGSSLSSEDKLPPVSEKVARLFKLSCLWHLLILVWWLLWLGTSKFSAPSVFQHTVFFCLHAVAAILWSITISRVPKDSRGRFEWLAVGGFTSIVTMLYFVRMTFYISRIGEPGA